MIVAAVIILFVIGWFRVGKRDDNDLTDDQIMTLCEFRKVDR